MKEKRSKIREKLSLRAVGLILAMSMVAGTLLPVGVGAEELPIDINNEEITVADVMMYEDTDMSEDEEENEAAAETEEVIGVVSEENSEEAPAETSEPEAAEPETTESEVSESEVSEPEVTEPVETEPETTEPEETEPEVPDFEETEPDEIITEEELPADAPEEEIYFCGIEEHEHTEECRNAPEEPDGEIIVEEEIPEEEPQPEEEPGELYCGYEVHVHDDTCWNEEYLADCGMEEHEHSENCYSLAYTLMAEFAAAVELFPDEADYILLDFDEADGSELLDEEAYYAAYAAFYEENPDIWLTTDALFAEAEAAYAEENPDGDIDAWMQDNGFWEAAEKFYWVVPTPDAVAEKTAQMEEVELEFTEEEEAPVFDSVKNALYEYRFKMYAYDENVYAQDEVVETYEADGITPEAFLNVYVEWTTLTAEEIDALTVSVVELYDETYDQMVEYALERYGEEELYKLRAYEVNFLLNGEPVDMTANPMTMEVELLNYERESMTFAMAEEEEPAPEAEVGTILSTLTLDETGAPVEVGSVFVEEGAEEETATLMSFMATSSNVVVYANSKTANPSFTVQYYANLEVISDIATDTSLTVIDTTNKKGLPQNGKAPVVKNIYLVDGNANSKKQLATDIVLESVYKEKIFEYITAPNLTYFNRLYENGNYSLEQIWLLKDDKLSNSINPADWNIYDADDIHFTNRADHPGLDSESSEYNPKLVLIQSNAVIRLVYNTTTNSYTNDAVFYDYDISNDGRQTSGTVTTIATDKKGINSDDNYNGYDSSAGHVKLAFGNDNTGTSLSGETIDNIEKNWLNQFNRYNYNISSNSKGCTFEIVETMQNGRIKYSSDIIAPDLFNEGGAIGKVSYDNGYSLKFNRIGDTYTLSQVEGTTINGLEYFNNPSPYSGKVYDHIWTNNFWPMDSAESWGATGHDIKFGSYPEQANRKYTGIDSSGNTQNGTLPVSDDGLDHNSYFGMQYAVRFELTEDYIGPLEYLFFGDDDMWVFLSKTNEEGTEFIDTQLVCDIGGVHSSVGELVDLWDYINKGSEGYYRLDFFYTERGASGSTCYMRFTLPSVSSITPEMNSGSLRIEKDAQSPFAIGGEFAFFIRFETSTGARLYDDYSYTKYNADGSAVETDLIIHDGNTVTLSDGQYIIIRYLPVGTRYYIEEKKDSIRSEYTTVTTYKNGEVQADGSNTVENNLIVKGTIPGANTMEEVLYVNVHHVIVDTGITLDYLPYIILFSIVGTGVILASADHRRRRED